MNFPRSVWIISKAFIQSFGWFDGGRSVLHGAWQLLKAVLTPESELSKARMEYCRPCIMYDEEMDTCGYVPEVYQDDQGKLHTIGCWCLCKFATRLKAKDCWGRVNKINTMNQAQIGWPDALRPKE